MIDPEKKKKVERLLKENSLPPEHAAIGKLIFAVEDKLDIIGEKLDNLVNSLNKKKE